MAERDKIFHKLNLQAEIDRLQKLLFVKDQQIRELQREVNDYTLREEQLIAELKRITSEQPVTVLSGHSPVLAATKEEFLDPKLNFLAGLNRAPKHTEGLEKNWSEMMVAYTDEIFLDEDTPDTILLRDDENRWYITPSGRTRLPFPISQSDLDNLNILQIRPATDTEVDDFIEKYNL